MHFPRERERLPRQVEQLLVLIVAPPEPCPRMSGPPSVSRRIRLERSSSSSFCRSSVLHRPPGLIGDDLAPGVGAVLADHHEGREEDRLERDDHRQQAEGVLLDAEADPAAEPEDVEVDEGHRARERSDPVGDPALPSWARSRACFSSAGLTGGGSFLGANHRRSRSPSPSSRQLEAAPPVDELFAMCAPFAVGDDAIRTGLANPRKGWRLLVPLGGGISPRRRGAWRRLTGVDPGSLTP